MTPWLSLWAQASLYVTLGVLPGAARESGAPVRVPAGRIAVLYGMAKGQKDLPVSEFRVDSTLVTNAAFARFVASHPEWRAGAASPLLTDELYLSHWLRKPSGEVAPPPDLQSAPVTNVSWYAARAFCEAAGGRLATTLEWEYLAAADERAQNATKDPKFTERILRWYSRPFNLKDLAAPHAITPNVYGVAQLHEWVWEWTEDFNGAFVYSDNRQDGAPPEGLACGAGALGATQREDYAAFMRYALRSSLEARYALPNLGFRCAYTQAPTRRSL
jgi:formylglycine-generating enzyme required for sulfatase activity